MEDNVKPSVRPVILLVDNRTRDLDVATLVAHHLERRGVPCRLEPLEAFRAVVGACRPSMIMFNHLFASHLVAWSKRLHEIGVLTAVLTNEGMMKTEESRRFQSGYHHREGNVDLFFCWNDAHRQTIEESGTYPEARVEMIGVPRFDFYFEPWANIVRQLDEQPRARPRILFCMNMGLAKFRDLPREHGDRHFAAWAGYQKNYGDPWKRVEAQWQGRQKALAFAEALAATGKYDIVFRPHPSEPEAFYREWLDGLPENLRAGISINKSSNITTLILDCDLQISEEGCTTGVESWIARKPTIGLSLYHQDSPLNFPERAKCHVRCDDPVQLPALVEAQLSKPVPAELLALRQQHIAKWCSDPDGRSCERIAAAIAETVKASPSADWSKLGLQDFRRAAKLLGYRALGLPYHFDPLLWIKGRLFGKRYAMKEFAYRKSIRPRDVAQARRRLEVALSRSST
jgi:surface carbohydrate biosynthesis protein